MTPESLQDLADLVREIAHRHLSPSAQPRPASRKADGSLVTRTDHLIQADLGRALQERWPQSILLGEEMAPAAQARALESGERDLWCIDPLDGTSNYCAGLPYYAVSVALLRGGRVAAGVVYDPVRRECFTAAQGLGAWCNGRPLEAAPAPSNLTDALALVDFKRLPVALATRLATHPPYRSQRSFGAVALDWCWLALGRCQLYLHGRQRLWDYAAGSLILAEAGGRAATLEGEDVFRPTLTPRSVAAASNPVLFREWLGWLDNGQSPPRSVERQPP